MLRLRTYGASVLLVLALLVSACGNAGGGQSGTGAQSGNETGAQSSDPVTLTFVGWGGPDEQAVFRQLVETFNQNNPDIVIEYTPTPDDYVTKLNTMITGGTPPDIAYIPDGNFSAFAPRGALVNLQPFIDASTVIDPENVWATALGRYRYDPETKTFGTGDIYALPKDIGPTVLYINKDLFAAANVPLPDPNVPLTWDEIVEIGRQITVDANGRHPGEEGFDINTVEVFGVGDIWFENAAYGNGGQIVSEDGRTFVADMPETVTGPCVKPQREPIFEFNQQAMGPGGEEFFRDEEDNLWMVYHTWTAPIVGYPEGERSLRIEPVTFVDGKPTIPGPTVDPQPLP